MRRSLAAFASVLRLLPLILLLTVPAPALADRPPIRPGDDSTATPVPSPTNSTVPVTFDVTGSVTSGTAGMKVPAGIPITLHVAHADPKTGAPVESVKRDTALSANLTFSFDKVTALPGDIAFVE